jgi:hypothetical protein
MQGRNQMQTFREWISKLAAAIATQRQLSRYNCAGCDLRDCCHLPPWRRQLCVEARAMRPHWR